MTGFRLRELRVENYRCFEALTFPLKEDSTILFAENGGGKTALLTAMAMGLAVFQKGSPKTLKLEARRAARMRTLDEKGRREPGHALSRGRPRWARPNPSNGLQPFSPRRGAPRKDTNRSMRRSRRSECLATDGRCLLGIGP
jgi:hypothetical protein